jgi:hypothetical protein
MIRYIVLVNSCFYTRKKIYPQFWARTLENVRQPSPQPKKFKECHFKGAQNYYFARGTRMCGASPDLRMVFRQ